MQSNTYLRYGDIKGEATAKGYTDAITILSADWGVGREITSYTGTSHDREASTARLYDVTITKLQDVASPDLFKEATVGTGKQASIHVTKQGAQGAEEIVCITLQNALISNYSLSVHDDRPVETLTISYTEVEFAVVPSDDTNSMTTRKAYTYSGTLTHLTS